MPRRPHARALATAVLVGALALAGCSGEDGTDGGPSASTDATGGTDAAPDATPEPSSAPTGPPSEPNVDLRAVPGERSAGGGESVVIEGDRAAFVLPSGNVGCLVNATTAMCEVEEMGFSVQPGHLVGGAVGDCTAANANAIMIAEQGAWTCTDDSVRSLAWVAAGGWWAKENGSPTEKLGNRTMAVLPYGSSLTLGEITCTSAESGATCRSSATGRGFTISLGSYNYG